VEYDWLTGLLHPQVMKEIERQIETPRWSIVEIPLLFEAGVAPWVTVTMFVTASKETRAERCRSRGWDEAEMAKRESFFLPGEERMRRSDYVIRNDGGMKTLKKSVEEVYEKAIGRKETYRAEAGSGVSRGGL
jgi:dephospho-CoA kinase